MKVLKLESYCQTYIVTGLTNSEMDDMIDGIQKINQRLIEEGFFLKDTNSIHTLPIKFSENPKISVYSTEDNLHLTKVEQTDIEFKFDIYPKSTARVEEISDSLISAT